MPNIAIAFRIDTILMRIKATLFRCVHFYALPLRCLSNLFQRKSRLFFSGAIQF
jgi:hypothetical protein